MSATRRRGNALLYFRLALSFDCSEYELRIDLIDGFLYAQQVLAQMLGWPKIQKEINNWWLGGRKGLGANQ